MSAGQNIPLRLDDVHAAWLTEVLTESGVLRNETIVNFQSRVVGKASGNMSDVVVLNLEITPNSTSIPKSLVLKIPTSKSNRRIGQAMGAYENEIRFYRELKHLLDIRTPECFYSAMSVSSDREQTVNMLRLYNQIPFWLMRQSLPLVRQFTGLGDDRFVLLIENLESNRFGDQLKSCSMDDAQLVLSAMAKLHARFWDERDLDRFHWLMPAELLTSQVHAVFLDSVDKFKSVHKEWLTSKQLQILDWLEWHYLDLIELFKQLPPTLIHGDFRLDNICFNDDNGEVIIYDWQTLSIGNAGFDLAYFLSSHSMAGSNDTAIPELLEFYRMQLADCGVHVTQKRLRWQYEAGLLSVLHLIVPTRFQDMVLLNDIRGDEMLEAWLHQIFKLAEPIKKNRLLAYQTIPQ